MKTACASVLAGSVAGRVHAEESAERPNVIVILTDDQGWGDLSVNGNTNLETPNIDSLAKDGALLDRFYVCPVCSPTRAEFLTGRYHPRGGVLGVSVGRERLNLDETTIGDTFKSAGYATGAFGKWHNGMQYPYHPVGRGFDEFYGFCSGHWGHYFDPVLEHNGAIVRGKGFIVDDLTDHALDFIGHNKTRPFFCYLPYNTPHSPMQVPERFFRKFKDLPLEMHGRHADRENLEKTRCALAMCENIDWNVGRILQKLDELGLAENTIVVYFSDNGPNGSRWNGDMKGQKGSTDEGGVRVPCIIRWPGHIKAGTRVPEIAAAIDLLPTLADLAEIPIEGTKPLDGVTIKPLLFGMTDTWADRLIFSHWRGSVSVRSQRYRMDNKGRLFDMVADPGQYKNISEEKPQVAAELSTALTRWKDEMVPGSSEDDRPFTVGYKEFPTTMLPARDGVPHGTIKRSSIYPNCSFFTHWTETDDSITWDVEVATAGEYETTIYYTCAEQNTGSTIELSFLDSTLQAKITEPHDPPLVGAAFDHIKRDESYVKDFRALRIGHLSLARGRGELTLRALDIPGTEAMDIRMVTLTLLQYSV